MIRIFSDGACAGNPGLGGWAAVIIDMNGAVSTVAGYEIDTTNNRMELTAAIMGLTAVVKYIDTYEILVHTDSTYLKDGITKWIYSWKKNDWRNGRIKNIDLWQQLDVVANISTMIKWIWVKAHSGIEYNELADKLAKNEIVSAIKRRSS